MRIKEDETPEKELTVRQRNKAIEHALWRLAKGCKTYEVKVITEEGESGKGKTKTEEVRREALPNLAAITMWLKAMMPKRWAEQEEKKDAGIKVMLDVPRPQEICDEDD